MRFKTKYESKDRGCWHAKSIASLKIDIVTHFKSNNSLKDVAMIVPRSKASGQRQG